MSDDLLEAIAANDERAISRIVDLIDPNDLNTPSAVELFSLMTYACLPLRQADPLFLQDGRLGLVQACQQKRMSLVQTLVKLGASINQREPASGLTPLMAAAMVNASSIVKLLLQCGADRSVRGPKVVDI